MGIRLPVAGESVEPGRQIRDADVVVVSPPSAQEPEAPLEAQPETTPSAIDTIKPYLKRGAKIDEKGRATLRKYILGREDFPELMAVYVRLKEKKYEGSLTTCKEDFSARTVQGTTTVWTLFMKLNTQEVAYMKSLELYRILKFVFEGTDVPVIQDEKKD